MFYHINNVNSDVFDIIIRYNKMIHIEKDHMNYRLWL